MNSVLRRIFFQGSVGICRGLALSAFLLPAFLLSAQSASPPTMPAPPSTTSPSPGEPSTSSAACPIRVDEAYLTAEPTTMPIVGSTAKRTLHVSLLDESGKQVISYVIHARIALRSTAASLNDSTAVVTRKWQGSLEPNTLKKEQWTFPADRFAMSLHRVWFDKVTFADGSGWSKSAGDSCSFAATGHVVQTKQR